MRKTTTALLLASLLAACGRSIPRYMQDAPRSDEETRRTLEKIRKELGRDFLVDHVESLFFVASNDGRASLNRCRGTISHVYRYLIRDYFSERPEKPIRVHLFRDKKTYEAYCKDEYGKKPDTPFGFYMSGERKMVMNISTGTGTLAHEIVHPLLAEDFPEVPSWFNEGFASLFEQSMYTRGGKMKGLVNWRLPGLQKALRGGKKVSLRTLLSTTSDEFYGDRRGVNYAAARYLCLYLQQNKLLVRFYKEFKKTHEDDPTGIKALEKVTDEPLDDFQPKWKDWALKLRRR